MLTITNSMRDMSVPDKEKFLKERYEFIYEFSKYWKQQGVDAIISPFFPHCGMKSENAKKIGLIIEYSAFWNVIGFPAGIMPVTKVA